MKRILILISTLLLAACQQSPVQPSAADLDAAAATRSTDLAEQLTDASAKRFDTMEQRMTLIQEKLIEQGQLIQRITLQGQQQLTLLQWLQQSQQIQAKQLADQRSEPSALDQLTELVFRLEQMSAESQLKAEPESPASTSITEPGFELVSVYGPKGWVVLKYDSRTGSTWKAEAGDWIAVTEVGVLPESNYQVVMQPADKDVKGHVAARIDRNTGVAWWLKNNQWEPF
tara:strand:- start:14041 stop:14727 length:687 start_codon:yes stop_codon:yes gene_type:complete